MRPAPILALAAMLLSASATAGPARPSPLHEADGTLVPGSQYTASLDQTHNRWRLQPLAGGDRVVATGTCATGAMIPAGVWLLVRDARGRPELLAPSTTVLPRGVADRVALRPCSQARGGELAVPAALLDLLAANTGAIYVYD